MFFAGKEFSGFQQGFGSTAAVFGAVITAHASVNTKGSYAALLGSVLADPSLEQCFTFTDSGDPGVNQAMALDLAIGVSGGDRILIPNLLVSRIKSSSGMNAPMFLHLPMRIPAGLNIYARVQSTQTLRTLRAQCFAWRGPTLPMHPTYSGCDAYGVNVSGATSGTTITPAAGSYSAWLNVGAVTSRAYRAIMLIVDGNPTTVATLCGYHYEVGYGSTMRYGRHWSSTSTGEDRVSPSYVRPIPASIPAGVQLQVRAQASSGVRTQNQEIALYCFY
jgi:hypothetical protein